AIVAVHPEDIPLLFVTVGHAAQSRSTATLLLRLWHKERGWSRSTVIISPLAPDEPFPFGFVATEDRSVTSDPSGRRLMALEGRLRRIAEEVAAAELLPAPRHVTSSDDDEWDLLDGLSNRQRVIVQHLRSGKRVATIARDLGISQSTVRNHLSVVFRKLRVHSQVELLEMLARHDSDRTNRHTV
ncbi:MAG TPA: LuxR C-terminal-related transcriptional regulator, partial [Acidimicrobiales bacterium]|nr:LuxR C-terminal-related transcriptional regulator [Acidimicrobiales bacterium]